MQTRALAKRRNPTTEKPTPPNDPLLNQCVGVVVMAIDATKIAIQRRRVPLKLECSTNFSRLERPKQIGPLPCGTTSPQLPWITLPSIADAYVLRTMSYNFVY